MGYSTVDSAGEWSAVKDKPIEEKEGEVEQQLQIGRLINRPTRMNIHGKTHRHTEQQTIIKKGGIDLVHNNNNTPRRQLG